MKPNPAYVVRDSKVFRNHDNHEMVKFLCLVNIIEGGMKVTEPERVYCQMKLEDQMTFEDSSWMGEC